MIVVMLALFLLGFVLDFIEITYIVVPVVGPALLALGVDPVWLGVMIAVNLQTSFLTPPFGFSLFYAGFPYMTFASLVTIFFAAPLITAVMAAIFLGESIGIHRKLALVVGFIGVIISMKPGSDSFQWVSLLPLICAMSYAISQIAVRRIGSREARRRYGIIGAITCTRETPHERQRHH